ncbi:MAG TPA: glycosyltransferase [Hydrogenothermaceae bacterium]|nr:glycosyltransferase [Hydrogenothermaceae bacterium]
MKRKKLLWINASPLKIAGGTESHSVDFINSLSKRKNIDLYVAVSKGSFIDKNINIPPDKKVYITIRSEFAPLAFFNLTKFAKKIKPDFVVGNNGKEYINTYLAGKIAKAKVLLFRHMTNKQPIFLRKYILSNIYKILAVSDYVKESLVNQKLTNVEVIPNFLSLNFSYDMKKRINFRKKFNINNKKVFLFVGRIEKGKGIFDFINFIKEVYNKDKNILAYVVGDGTDAKNAKKLVKSLKLNNVFTFTGVVSNVWDYYLLSDFFIMPSYADESFGRTAIEAMSMKNVVIAYPAGNVKFLIKNGENGFITKNKNYLQILEIYENVKENVSYLNKIKENAYEFSNKNFSEKAVVDKFIDLILEEPN